MNLLSLIFSNANTLFPILVFCIWLGITATYVAEMGVLEFIAPTIAFMLMLIIAIIATGAIWISLILIGVIAGFLIIPFIKREYAVPYGVMGVGLQAFSGFFLDAGRVSFIVLILTTIIPFAYYYFVLIPLMSKIRSKSSLSRDELIIGKHGWVMSSVDPVGIVNVDGEIWTAVSEENYAKAGQKVIVIACEGTKLIVEPLKRKNSAQEFADTE